MLYLNCSLSSLPRVTAAGVLVGSLALPTLAQGTDKAPERPSYSFLRQDEDWRTYPGGWFGDADPFDPIKHVNLSDDGETWISFGGRLEARYESWKDFAFGGPNDDEFIVSRLLTHADLHAGEDFRAFLELKSAQATDRALPGGRRPLDMDTFEIQQLFVDVTFDAGDGDLRLRPGRQALSFGRQRLISPLPWGNTLRTWEGLTALWKTGGWAISGLATAFVPVDKTEPNEVDEDELLYGVYARRADGPAGLELFLLGNERPQQTVNGTVGDARRQTLGARSWGPFGDGLDYEAEGALQVGTVGGGDVAAGFLSTELGWRPGGAGSSPRYALGLDWASGDDEAGGDVGTFDQLYPLGHAYLGFADFIGRQNVVSGSLIASWKPQPELTLRASAHSFFVADKADAIYNAGGGVLRAPGSFTSSHVADEIDLLAVRQFGRHVTVTLGYSHVFDGQAIADSGPSEDVDFLYLWVQTTL